MIHAHHYALFFCIVEFTTYGIGDGFVPYRNTVTGRTLHEAVLLVWLEGVTTPQGDNTAHLTKLLLVVRVPACTQAYRYTRMVVRKDESCTHT